MVTVRLIYDMPRTLRDWPPFGSVMELPEDEAETLVYSRCAEYVTDEVSDDNDFDDDLTYEAPDDEDDDFGYGDNDSDEDSSPEEHARPPRSLVVKKPRTVDPKSKWLEYAHSRGYDGDDTITKNRLIAQYGD